MTIAFSVLWNSLRWTPPALQPPFQRLSSSAWCTICIRCDLKYNVNSSWTEQLIESGRAVLAGYSYPWWCRLTGIISADGHGPAFWWKRGRFEITIRHIAPAENQPVVYTQKCSQFPRLWLSFARRYVIQRLVRGPPSSIWLKRAMKSVEVW